MTKDFIPPQRRPAWAALEQHALRLRTARISTMLRDDPARVASLTRSHDGILVDHSKQRLDAAALASLVELAKQCGLPQGIESLFGAQQLNFTEGRAALHMAMRGGCEAPALEAESLALAAKRVRAFASTLHEGQARGATGNAIRTVINLGIGGSDLGPRMAAEALVPAAAARRTAPEVRFVANIDPRDLDEALATADPATTLFIVSSKSFSTAETLANAQAARDWLRAALGADANIAEHFAAVSNATSAAAAFGIDPQRVFPLPEWVGGRYSVWSAIGLPLMVAIGPAAFDEVLAGGRAMDQHFRSAPFADNLPVLLGLIGLWNADFLGIESLALLPYAHGLRNLPAWLQQLEMESNGKRCLRDGSPSEVATSPIVWGGAGTVGQHAFHQLFYQGTRTVALDFIVPVGSDDPRQRGLVENALAQSAALMEGRDLSSALASLQAKGMSEDDAARLAPHLVCPGNQPSSTLLLPRVDAYHLGQLLALYEHKVFVQGWIWGINSFDQYGVELGKEMARALATGTAGARDASTAALLAAVEKLRDGADT